MLVCLRNNKRTESNTGHPALVGKSSQAVRASSGNQCDGHLARPELRPKKIGYSNAYEISFSRRVFLCFIHKHCIEKHRTNMICFVWTRNALNLCRRTQVLWNHIAVLIALLTTLTQSKYRCTFLSRWNCSCACSFRWIYTLICTVYTMSSPTRHLKTIRRTQTKLFVNFKWSN